MTQDPQPDLSDDVLRYGPHALISGAARPTGLGYAFAEALAARGLSLILVDVAEERLEESAAALREAHAVEVHTVALDLGREDAAEQLQVATDGKEVGLLICNHFYTPPDTPEVLDMELDTLHRMLYVNARAYTTLAHLFGRPMRERGHGGIIIVSSGAGRITTPFTGAYAANKAYQIAMGEALWYELKDRGVDVLTVSAGLMNTQGDALKRYPQWLFSEPGDVVEETLRSLGRKHLVAPGWATKLMLFYQTRILTRRRAVQSTGDFMRSGLGKDPS